MATLRSKTPTFRVFLETIGDAITALISGFVVYLLLTVWGSIASPVSHQITFGLLFAAGWMRIGFITLLDESLKTVFAAITDGVITWIAAKTGAMVKTAEDKKEQ